MTAAMTLSLVFTVVLATLSVVFVYLCIKMRKATNTEPPLGVVEPYYCETQGTALYTICDDGTTLPSEKGVVISTADDPISFKDCEAYMYREQATHCPEDDDYI